MAQTPSIDEAIERARRMQHVRIDAIRALAQARQDVTETRERAARELAELQARHAGLVRAVEEQDVKQYRAATAAGWTADELRKIGYDAPEKVTRVSQRAKRRTVRAATAAATDEHDQA